MPTLTIPVDTAEQETAILAVFTDTADFEGTGLDLILDEVERRQSRALDESGRDTKRAAMVAHKATLPMRRAEKVAAAKAVLEAEALAEAAALESKPVAEPIPKA